MKNCFAFFMVVFACSLSTHASVMTQTSTGRLTLVSGTDIDGLNGATLTVTTTFDSTAIRTGSNDITVDYFDLLSISTTIAGTTGNPLLDGTYPVGPNRLDTGRQVVFGPLGSRGNTVYIALPNSNFSASNYIAPTTAASLGPLSVWSPGSGAAPPTLINYRSLGNVEADYRITFVATSPTAVHPAVPEPTSMIVWVLGSLSLAGVWHIRIKKPA